MNIVCVSGGSYKAFYLNNFLKLANCDLLVFNFGVFYNINLKSSQIEENVVVKELISLSLSLNCVVVAGVFVENKKDNNKAIIAVCGHKISINKIQKGADIKVNNCEFVVGDENTNYLNNNKIVLSCNRIKPNIKACAKNKIYIFCDSFGLYFVYNKKIERKFNKYSKIILK